MDYYLLFLCTVLSFIKAFLGLILKPIIAIMAKIGKSNLDVARVDISNTKREMDRLSITDNFAKYIKLQRKLNKLQVDLKEQLTERLNYALKIRYGVTFALYAIINIVHLTVCWWLWQTPIVVLPEEWLYPVGGLLSWPTTIAGGVSIPAWLLISHSTAKAVSNLIQRSF